MDVETLVDGLVAALNEKVDELMADGRITEDRAAEIKESAPERIENFVNAQVRLRRGFWLTSPAEEDPDA
jgi:hypothetical protein